MNVRGHIDEVRFVDPLARKLDPGGTRRVPEGASVYFRGWAFVTDPPRAADAVVATIDDHEPFELSYNQTRADVVKAFNLPPMLPIGFHGVASLANLARGPHVLRIALVDRAAALSASLDETEAFEIVDGALAFPATERLRRDELTVEIDAFTTDGSRDGKDALDAPIARGRIVTIRGWAVDRRFVTAASDVYACIDSTKFVRGVIGTMRTDVAGSIGTQTVARCGYVVRFETTNLEQGGHVVDVRAVAADGDRYALSDVLPFTVA